MHGFSAQNYYDANMNTMKYQFARIAADYDPRQPGALERWSPTRALRRCFPTARLVGKDSIDFGGQLSEGGGRGVPVGVRRRRRGLRRQHERLLHGSGSIRATPKTST